MWLAELMNHSDIMHTTNSPVASILAHVSFLTPPGLRHTEMSTHGGSWLMTVEYENGAAQYGHGEQAVQHDSP